MTTECEAFKQALSETQNQPITWSRESNQNNNCNNNNNLNYANKTNYINGRFTKAEKWTNVRNFGNAQTYINQLNNNILICNQNEENP